MSEDHEEESPSEGGAAWDDADEASASLSPEQWLEELLAEGREARGLGARPIVQSSEDDPPELLALLERRARARVELRRRGVDHGTWYELEATPGSEDTTEDPARERARQRARFAANRPLVLRSAVAPGEHGREGLALLERVRAGLLPDAPLPPGLSPLEPSPLRPDPARDRARWVTRSQASPLELWAKAALLSDHPDEESWRLRVSAGREPDDEGCRDDQVHQEVTRLADALLPGAPRVQACQAIRSLLRECLGGEPLLTQTIAYWNCPGGGALLHHDAFEEPLEGGQRGVVYTQLAGRTAWVAVSSRELGHEVQAALRELLTEGSLPTDLPRERAWALASDPEQAAAELALPGCGALAGLVHGGEPFTGRLVDSGHAFLLEAGDAVVLPNHGPRGTCFHGVFCASAGPTYALSSAVRRPGPPPAPELETVRIGRSRRSRRRSRRRGR
ncbi:MAG: hypothetical protein ISQ08_12340 [Planctomycetes bacterium]|nr:hypothetical protein [Planctomycetota bacterium]